MQVQNATLKGLVQGEKQFRVPIWQRQYTWGRAQHEQLWNDLSEQYDHVVGNGKALTGHFLGSFVLSPVDPTASGVQTFLVIDGQQRLTTLMLVLCALRDLAATDDTQPVDRFDKLYLINEFQAGPSRFRLQPTEEDRGAYYARVERAATQDRHDPISEAYRFYAQKLREPRLGGTAINVSSFERVIADRMEIVEITTEPGDNAHRIFQSINGTGVDLNQADLLRNYIFMLLPTCGDAVYEQVWRPMEALIGVENLTGLARVDLQRRGTPVATDGIYVAHQRRLDPISHDEGSVREEVEDLAVRARHYKSLVDPSSEPDTELAAGLGRLARWGAQTSYPVLMVAFDLREREQIETSELRRTASLIESFLVRRQLARIATNSLSRLFVQIIDRLPDGPGFADALHYELSRERLDWPDDEWIRAAVRSQRFFHIGRWDQRKLILERLERSLDHPEKIDFDESALQIEHILPQTLSAGWREQLSALGQDPDEVHSDLVHTLGNLTLTAFNGTLSNNPFERKREIYGESHLELNRALQETKSWGRDEILARADVLAKQVSRIWISPLPDIKDKAPGAFDWSRVEAAIEALPLGRWTAYSDLAELGGTAAQAVGNFVANTYHGTNAYRVLAADGRVSPAFHWGDPNDTRDVLELLTSEGIDFDDGRANASRRMTGDELASLMDTDDEDDVMLDRAGS
jgi:alkylated DNA nucleotide flippase Atl1